MKIFLKENEFYRFYAHCVGATFAVAHMKTDDVQ
jgi:hypothetical protein